MPQYQPNVTTEASKITDLSTLNRYTPSELVETLIAFYKRKKPVPIILGSPGCGKTAVVYSAFRDILKIPVAVFQATLYDPTEIKGLPVFMEETVDGKIAKVAKFLPFADMPAAFGDEQGVLFIDDLPHAPQATQNAFMRIALEGIAGAWKIGNLFVVGAGNRTKDRAGAKDMQTAMANRFCFMEFVSDYSDWRSWAVSANMYPPIIAFLGCPHGRDWLNRFDPSKQINATQRSWEFASEAMVALGQRKNDALQRKAVAGCVGDEAMTKFFGWINVYSRLPDIDKIIKGDNIYSDDLDVMYATVSALVSTAKQVEKGKKAVFQRLIDYAEKMPDTFVELGAFMGKDLFKIDEDVFIKLSLDAYQERYEPLVV